VKIDRFTPEDQLPEYMRVTEYAAYRDVSPGAVYEQIKRGELEVERIGRLIRIRRSSRTNGMVAPDMNGSQTRGLR
jgi:excisionase family DNA binding protein